MNLSRQNSQVLLNHCVQQCLADVGIYRGPRVRHTFISGQPEGGERASCLCVSVDRQGPSRHTMTITTALKGALNDAISSGKFIDTQIILFSRRDGSGRVCKPKALYTNSHVLKSVPYFNDRELPSRSTCCTCIDPLLECSLAHS